ncbi:ZNF74 protein, partial [Turnix velox]|nr:ZNF74 protein [Turnix velox]
DVREWSHPCTECGKRFRLKINLIIHQRSHAKEGPYDKCPYCKKFLSCPSNLQRHLQTHSQERPFCCGSCQKCFTRRTHLTRHQLIHE